MYTGSMVHSNNILNKKIKKTYLIIIIGLIISISLIPILQANFIYKENYNPNPNIKKTDKSFTNCVLFVIGKISNPRIEKQDTNKYLIFHAKEVYVSGFYQSYDGYYDITQWIYDEEVKLNWRASGPMFRGIIIKNYILGVQRARFI
jgi:hypothetical protein